MLDLSRVPVFAACRDIRHVIGAGHCRHRLLVTCAFILLLGFGVSSVQADEGVDGSWTGAINIMGQKLGIKAHFKTSAGALSITLDIPQQGATGLPMQNVSYSHPKIHFEIPGASVASFDGTVDGNSISGDFLQSGKKGTFTLQRTGADARVDAKPGVAAADTPQAPIAQEGASTSLEEVIVTAQKREQSLGEIPMSITVLGGTLLERQQAFDFEDMTALIPGFSIVSSTPGVTRITLRGINTGGVASTVGVYFDEVPFGSSTALANGAVLSGDFDTFDMNRVEVLRGPQGTLYGASSMGGVIKYVPNQPDIYVFEGSAKIGLEDIKDGGIGYNATGYVNVPLSETFALRASAFYREREGYVDTIGGNPLPSLTQPGVNIIDGTMVEKGINANETSGGRLQALFQPNDDLSINLTAMFQSIDADDATLQLADADTLKPLYPNPVLDRYQDAFNTTSYDVYSANINWKFSDWASLESITGYGEFEQKTRSDADVAANVTGGPPLSSLVSLILGMPVGIVQEQVTSTDKFTQEFRLISAESNNFEWLAGLYYTDEDSQIYQNLPALVANTETPVAGLAPTATVYLNSTYEEIAAFGNATWFVTDRFEMSFGARQSKNDQNVSQTVEGFLVGVPPGVVVATGGKSSESPFTWSFSPRYELDENSSLYFRVATGFRPGGPNVLPPGVPDSVPAQYDADSLTNYELGYKMGTADGRFALEVAAFYIDWEDIQLTAVVENFGVNVNGGTAISKGVEFSSSFAATDALTFAFNGAYTDAYLTAEAGAAGEDGDPLSYVPEWSFGLSGEYEWNLSSGSTAYFGGTLGYMGDRPIGRFLPSSNGEIQYLGDYATLFLHAGFDTGKWFYEIYAKNITDENAVQAVGTGNIAWTGNVEIGFLQPRTIGATAGIRF